MNILVFNCGSSSLTYKIFQPDPSGEIAEVLSGKAHRVGVKGTEPSFIENHLGGEDYRDVVPIPDHRTGARLALEFIAKHEVPVDLIGHRFVHGGSYFERSVRVDAGVLGKLELCIPLAPIHNPTALSVIQEALGTLPEVPAFVAIDSAFHSTIPACARAYALPPRIVEEFEYRKYGFHGLSYTWVAREASRFLGRPAEELRIVACHLGTGGSSVAAIEGGRSIDTSMGYSPLPGLVMSSRSGDIDPMLSLYLLAVYGYLPDDLLNLLNKKSGLLGLSGLSSDITDLIKRFSETGDDQARLAFDMYIHRLKKYVGSYIAALGGIDVLVFTDSIGVENALVREKVCENMAWAGIVLDAARNKGCVTDRVCPLGASDSRVAILSVPTEEELVICLEGLKLTKEGRPC